MLKPDESRAIPYRWNIFLNAYTDTLHTTYLTLNYLHCHEAIKISFFDAI